MNNPVAVQSGSFQHGAHQLGYEIYGNDGVPCILVHGLLLDSLVNRELAQKFASLGYRVVLLDLLGHGRSDKPTDPCEHRIDFYAEQLLACLDHLGIQQALMGGVSLGAITALEAATRAPQRCLGLFIEMPVMEWSTTFAAMLLVPVLTAADFGKWFYRPLARLLRRLPRPRTPWMASALNAASAEPEVITAVLHGILVGPVVPSTNARRKLTMPALVIGHAGDRLHSLRDAIALARELPDARLLKARSILELRARPQRLWPDIRDFLLQVRERAPVGARRPNIVSALLPTPATAPATVPAEAASGSGELQAQFEAAVAQVRNAPPDGPLKPSNETKLKLYALYRQATDGDVQGKRPGITDMVGRFKYDAWAALKGMSRQQAMLDYVAAIENFRRQAGNAAKSA
jgi:acyl-CoA-binding protein/pimeloyl-ACP methyl ester carboxylesterase